MQQSSNVVASNQTGLHPKLAATVRRHCQQPLRSPIADHTQSAFDDVSRWLAQRPEAPLALDSGCGTGLSSRVLAARHPRCNVIGIDRSLARLTKGLNAERQQRLSRPPNVYMVQADLVDFWRLAARAGWQLQQHYILYPNPYPKSGQMKRRWHGHAVFPSLLALGGELQLRSNWRLYLQEFAAAVTVSGNLALTDDDLQRNNYAPAGRVKPLPAGEPSDDLTLFEAKYRRSGQPLYQLSIPAAKA